MQKRCFVIIIIIIKYSQAGKASHLRVYLLILFIYKFAL